ncbi:hypothetical protein XENOCAPTIV_007217, partial [Xenoophorus captivus]
MERHEADVEEEAAEEADLTVRGLSFILGTAELGLGWVQFRAASEAQKRPGGSSQSAELPAPRKDAYVHAAQPSEKDGSVEALKSKLLEVRETALPPPSVRVLGIGFVTPSVASSVEQAAAAGHASMVTAPKSKSLSEPAQDLLMIASPRPPLRPKQDSPKTSKTEAGSTPCGSPSSLPQESSLSQKLDEEHTGTIINASGDTEKSEKMSDSAEVGQIEAIMDEEPPWKTDPVETAELRGRRYSSECEEDLSSEASEGLDSEDVEEDQEPLESQAELPDPEVKKANMDESVSPGAQEKAAKGKPAKSTKLTAQLELHRLEGVGLTPEP